MTENDWMIIVRKLATVFGTWLLNKGWGEDNVQLAIGALTIAGAALWSLYVQRVRRSVSEQKIAAALTYNPTPDDDVLQIAKAMASDKVSVAEAQTLGNGGAK